MNVKRDRRQLLKLSGLGAVVFASGLPGWAEAASRAATGAQDFYFVQLSDTHWGFRDPASNPDSEGTLRKAVEVVNGLEHQPDFVFFTGDLTHNHRRPGGAPQTPDAVPL